MKWKTGHKYLREDVMSVSIKRVYEVPESTDGMRVLVDRLWPRGITKEEAKIDLWLKDIAPSTGLRSGLGMPQKNGQSSKESIELNLRATLH